MSIAEKLRGIDDRDIGCSVDYIALAITGKSASCGRSCAECRKDWTNRLANAIEDELKASKPTPLPDGVIWPTYEDGELVRFGDEFDHHGEKLTVKGFSFHPEMIGLYYENYAYIKKSPGQRIKRPEPEVLDADGVPIKVGDTVYYTQPSAYTEGERIVDTIVGKEVHFTNGYWADPAHLTHHKPDTQEAINQDAALLVSESFFDQRRDEFEDRVFDLLKRQRKLLGGN